MEAVSSAGVRVDPAAIATVVRAMFPHLAFPDGPYERTAAAIVESGTEDPRIGAQLAQGLAELDAAGFVGLGPAARLDYLGTIAGTIFFETIRAKTILVFYNDPEVWELLGYEGPAFDQGGYVGRGFDDLDWLPDPRIEEAA